LKDTLGKYRLIRRVGVGGMAEVYEAELLGSEGFSRRVALKVLLPACQRDPEFVAMFIDEATLVAKFEHPNVIAVHDFGEADGSHYMAMEYIDGWDLGELIQASRSRGRPFPVGVACTIVRELCRALHYVHEAEHGVIHRDVTPHNVFVTRGGQVKLGDFGIAKSAARQSRTEDGQIKGKLPYLAPEQIAGDDVTRRTDVYAAGLILYELLAGRRLVSADRELDLFQVALNPPSVELASARPDAAEIEVVVRQALERHPTMRHHSAAALGEDLEGHTLADTEELARFAAELVEGTGAAAADAIPLEDSPAEERPGTRVLLEPRRGRSTGRIVAYMIAVVAAGGLIVVAARALWAPESTPPVMTRPDLSVVARAQRDASVAPAPDGPLVDLAAPPDAAAVAPRPKRPRRPRPKKPLRVSDAATPPPKQTPDAAPRTNPAEERRIRDELERLKQLARSRGLWPGDDPRADRLAASARASLGKGRLDQARGALKDLRRRVEAFRIDRAFVKAKMARLDRAINAARLPPARQRRMAAASRRILVLIMEERFVEASRLMSETRARLPR
jgi:serine/threonine-protein kinase